MGAEISNKNLNPFSPTQSSLKSKLNFEGIKDHAKSSIFSCICTQKDTPIPNEKNPIRFSSPRQSTRKRSSLPSTNSIAKEDPHFSQFNQDLTDSRNHPNKYELISSIIRPKLTNINQSTAKLNKRPRADQPQIKDQFDVSVRSSSHLSSSSRLQDSIKSSSFHSRSSVNKSISTINLKKNLDKSNSSIYDINDFSEDRPGHLKKDALVREGDRKYKGDLKDGKPHGFGKETCQDGSTYEGTYLNGVRTGQGIYTWSDGSCYKGSFRNNHMHGFGTFEWCNGNKYEGMWKDSKMHGEGKYIWKNGNSYTGGYADGLKHGDGVFVYSNGKCVKSTWVGGSIQVEFND